MKSVTPRDIVWDKPDDDLDFEEDARALSPWDMFLKWGGDPRFFDHHSEEWKLLEHWWLQELATYETAALEDELAHITSQLIDLDLNPEFGEGLIDGVQWHAILQQRALWLTAEIRRRRQLPPRDAPREGRRLSRDFVRDLKGRVNLPEYLMRTFGMELKREGGVYTACCPMHPERTPSFKVWPDRWTCFGACQQSGDIFDILLVMGLSHVRTWREAVDEVAKYAGVPIGQAAPIVPIVSGGTAPLWESYVK